MPIFRARDRLRLAVEAAVMTPSLAGARRVLVLGGCGAGKSTLTRRLAAALGLPAIHLDAEYFAPGWVEPEATAWRDRLLALAARDQWVMDGNHAPTLPQRLARAEAVVWLDLPTGVCFRRVLLRLARGYGRVRVDMAPGCPERLDPAFLLYVLRFRATQRPKLAAALRTFPGPVLAARSAADVRALFDP